MHLLLSGPDRTSAKGLVFVNKHAQHGVLHALITRPIWLLRFRSSVGTCQWLWLEDNSEAEPAVEARTSYRYQDPISSHISHLQLNSLGQMRDWGVDRTEWSTRYTNVLTAEATLPPSCAMVL